MNHPFPEAKKSLGQNYLVDPNIKRRIAEAIGAKAGQPVIEIGPGPGAITGELLKLGAHVTAVEKDERFLPYLEDLSTAHDNRLTIEHTDVLKLNLTDLAPIPCPLAGNLPYNIGTQIVINALQTPGAFTHMVFLLQKEVVDRITAQPGSKDWGRLGVLCSALADCEKLFDVPGNAFVPKPRVTSSLVKLTPLQTPRADVDVAKLSKLTEKAFGQRRKMLRASLKGLLDIEAVEAAGIDPTRRPETLTLDEFAALTKQMA